MAYKDIAIVAEQWPLDERLLLLESLMHSVRRELAKTSRPEAVAAIKLVRGILSQMGPYQPMPNWKKITPAT